MAKPTPKGTIRDDKLVYFRLRNEAQHVQHFADYGVDWKRPQLCIPSIPTTDNKNGWDAECWRR